MVSSSFPLSTNLEYRDRLGLKMLSDAHSALTVLNRVHLLILGP